MLRKAAQERGFPGWCILKERGRLARKHEYDVAKLRRILLQWPLTNLPAHWQGTPEVLWQQMGLEWEPRGPEVAHIARSLAADLGSNRLGQDNHWNHGQDAPPPITPHSALGRAL